MGTATVVLHYIQHCCTFPFWEHKYPGTRIPSLCTATHFSATSGLLLTISFRLGRYRRLVSRLYKILVPHPFFWGLLPHQSATQRLLSFSTRLCQANMDRNDPFPEFLLGHFRLLRTRTRRLHQTRKRVFSCKIYWIKTPHHELSNHIIQPDASRRQLLNNHIDPAHFENAEYATKGLTANDPEFKTLHGASII